MHTHTKTERETHTHTPNSWVVRKDIQIMMKSGDFVRRDWTWDSAATGGSSTTLPRWHISSTWYVQQRQSGSRITTCCRVPGSIPVDKISKFHQGRQHEEYSPLSQVDIQWYSPQKTSSMRDNDCGQSLKKARAAHPHSNTARVTGWFSPSFAADSVRASSYFPDPYQPACRYDVLWRRWWLSKDKRSWQQLLPRAHS